MAPGLASYWPQLWERRGLERGVQGELGTREGCLPWGHSGDLGVMGRTVSPGGPRQAPSFTPRLVRSPGRWVHRQHPRCPNRRETPSKQLKGNGRVCWTGAGSSHRTWAGRVTVRPGSSTWRAPARRTPQPGVPGQCCCPPVPRHLSVHTCVPHVCLSALLSRALPEPPGSVWG